MSDYEKRQKLILPEEAGEDNYEEYSQEEYSDEYDNQPLNDSQQYSDDEYYDEEYTDNDEYYDEEDSEEYDNQEYSDIESHEDYDEYGEDDDAGEGDYDSHNSRSSVDERLEQIYRRLEEMDKIQSTTAHEVTQISQPTIPFYMPQTPPYYMPIPPQSTAGGNDIILNELAKLREDTYRAQHKSELKETIERMREDFESKFAPNRSLRERQDTDGNPLLAELRKISARIEKLEKDKSIGSSRSSSQHDARSYGVVGTDNDYYSTVSSLRRAPSVSNNNASGGTRVLNASALRTDEILAAVKAIKLAVGADNAITYDDKGNAVFLEAENKLSELKTLITQSSVSLSDKVKAVIRFNELMGEIPAGARQDIDFEFDKIRGIIFGLTVTKEMARELVDGFASSDRGINIEEYFQLKESMFEGDKRDMPAIALKLLERKNRLQGNRYINYNEQLYNELLSANNEYISADASRRENAALRLKKAADIFGALRVGDLVAISDYKTVRPALGFKSITDKINEILDIIKGGSSYSGDGEEDSAILDEITSLKETTVLLGEERHNIVLEALNTIKQEIKELKEQGVRFDAESSNILNAYNHDSDVAQEEYHPAPQPAQVLSKHTDNTVDLSEVIKEFADIKEMLSFKCDPDYDTLAQIASLKEEMRISRTEQEEVLLDNINALRDEIRALSEYSEEEYSASEQEEVEVTDPVAEELTELKDQIDKIISKLNEPSPESELLYEVRALKEEVFVAKGEIDPEILKEIRNLKEMLSAAKEDDPLNNITVELSRLREDIAAGGDTSAVANKLEEFRARLDKLKPIGIAEAAEISINVVKDSIVEILNEITALRDEINARNAENESFYADMVSIKEGIDKTPTQIDLSGVYERLEGLKGLEKLSELDKLSQINLPEAQQISDVIEKLDFLTDTVNSLPPATAAIDGEVLRNEIVSGLNSVKQELAEYLSSNGAEAIASLPVFGEVAAHTRQLKELNSQINLLKEQLITSKAQSDAAMLVESTALREQVIALKNVVSTKDISGLTQALSNEIEGFRTATLEMLREELGAERIRAIVREEIAAIRADDNKDAQMTAMLGDFIGLFDKQAQTQSKEISEIVRSELAKFASEQGGKRLSADGEAPDAAKIANSISTLKEELAELVKMVGNEDTVYTVDSNDSDIKEYPAKHLNLVNQLRSGGVPEDSIRDIINSLESDN